MPVAAPPTASLDGTVFFTGFHVPKIEATITEKNPDGSLGKSISVVKETVVGRNQCDVNYPDDVLLSPRHACLEVREGRLHLRDLDSQNGTFVRQREDSELTPGDMFVVGRKLFRFATQGREEAEGGGEGTVVWSGAPKLQRGPVTAKLELIKITGEVMQEFRLEKPETTLGRAAGDLVFKDDPYMSGKHARIVAQGDRFVLQDLKSRNGVYRRIHAEIELLDGDEFFLGEQIFQVAVKVVE